MNNKNKLIVLAIFVALVAIPYWRIKSNSTFFVEGLMLHLSHLGTWTHSSIDTSLNGKVTVNDVRFTPKGYRQTASIKSIDINTDMRKLMLSSAQNLRTHVPANMTLSFNNVQLQNNAKDFITTVEKNSYWPMAAGYLGAYGCGTDPGPGFSPEQWDQILPTSPQFNMELSYSMVDSYHMDFNLNIDNVDNWFIAWSGTLTRPSDVPRITFNDTIVDKLYYYHVDQGFNKKRNDYCATQHNNSFSAYRLKGAEEIQAYLRVYAGKEMTQFFSNQYQRSLAENIEVNTIFKLKEPKYLYEFFSLPQKEAWATMDIEAAIGENEYQAVELAEIDFLELDMETLRAEMEAKEQEAIRVEKASNQPKELLKTITHNIGGTKSEYLIENWTHAVGQNIKVRTKRGRPIFGKLLSANGTQLTISTRYMRGNATITVAKKDVVSMTANR
ncbi:hypothetical protein [Marinicella litoralis]|uniref:Uncharacterized protein n=1 Tax=Marinicella litoralis TaxID=644220 RepID=A0A4R6XYC3_9GAMM|nr:hypothetical protein [Marinicella litoralis]TDR23639.1 hypothetical protein C8D91_0503 [Marinicella litoralis]